MPLALAAGLSLSWGLVLALADAPDAVLAPAVVDLARAYPDPGRREGLLGEAARWTVSISRLVALDREGMAGLVRAGLVVTALHGEVAGRLIPMALVLAGAGIGAGLACRERLRDGPGYASPTASGLAVVSIVGGLFWEALYSLSPIPASSGWLYASAAAVSLGGMLYVANLPLRL